MNDERLQTIKTCLDRRQPDLTVIMENVIKPHNLAAVARTLEAVGGLDIHAISAASSIRLSQMAAGGVRRWIRVRKHPTTEQGVMTLKQQGFRIVATLPGNSAKDFRELDYTKPTAILVGTELDGISEQAVQLADEAITIPMLGMVQSLNVSVATALVLYEACRQRDAAGMYNRRALDDETYNTLLFEACHTKVAQYCRRKKLPYPAIDDNGNIVEPVADSQTFSHETFNEWLKNQGH